MAETSNDTELLPLAEELASGPNFATVGVLLPNGQIQNQVLWVGVLDGQLVINTEVHRARYKALQADPRITVTVWQEGEPHRYAEIRGKVTAETTGARALANIHDLSRKYTGHDYPAETIRSERVILHVTPERQVIVDLTR